MEHIDTNKIKEKLFIACFPPDVYVEGSDVGNIISALIDAIETLQHNQNKLLEKIESFELKQPDQCDCPSCRFEEYQ